MGRAEDSWRRCLGRIVDDFLSDVNDSAKEMATAKQRDRISLPGLDKQIAAVAEAVGKEDVGTRTTLWQKFDAMFDTGMQDPSRFLRRKNVQNCSPTSNSYHPRSLSPSLTPRSVPLQ